MACVALAAALGVRAQDASAPDAPAVREADRLEDSWLVAFRAGRFDDAAADLRRLCALEPASFVHPYNLACALALAGRPDEGGEALEHAVVLGFTDLHDLERDPHLDGLRAGASYRAIIDGWARILDATGARQADRERARFGGRYTQARDDRLRLSYLTAFDEQTFALARDEIGALASWWERRVAPIAQDPVRPDPWVVVVLPTGEDYARWAADVLGPRSATVGGVYDHDAKRLVARDLGPSLRHELLHVLHWRSMSRLGQRHPVWIQEGLCSLAEDVDLLPDGSLAPAPSWRTNMARRLERAGRLPGWDGFVRMDSDRFVGTRPLANYAVARAIFLFLDSRGLLGAWYDAYTRGFERDPTGLAAIEDVFDRPLREVEREFRSWLRALPEVPDTIEPGMATLPFDVGPGAGDGLVITSPVAGTGATGLKMGDVILSVDGRTVRDERELARILSELEPGAEVSIAYRRGTAQRGEGTAPLIPAGKPARTPDRPGAGTGLRTR